MQLFDENDLNQRRAVSGNHGKMLTLLADMGCSKHVLAALLEMDRAHKDHILFLIGPVIQHRSQWASSTPPWLYQAVTGDRLRIILEEHESGKTGWQVGPAELTAVMYPASMEAPMRMEYADIYLWAAAQANARHYGKPLDEIRQQVGGDPVPDKSVTAPAGRYHQDYRHLCSDIRRRVVAASKQRQRDEKSASRHASDDTPDIQQLSLF